MDGKQLWQTILGQLEVTVSKANYTTWLKNTSFLNRQDDVLIIGVANVFTKQWLEDKYQTKILEACIKIDPTIKKIEYKVNTLANMPNVNQDNPAEQEVKVVGKSDNTKTWTKPSTRYTFESFIVGSHNRLAHAAAMAVAKTPGRAYNPLFLYGGVGLGKTHLMQAIGNQIRRESPEKKVMYCTSEKFTNDLIQSIKDKKADHFKREYRNIDILLVDDIQFIAGKEQTQEEFFHTFNHLYEEGKQVVMTSDRPPRAIATLQERLSSRFESGMIADVQPPDLETRIAILKHKSAEAGMLFENELLETIAGSIQHNIRELEGALNRLIAQCQFYGDKPNKNTVDEILGSILNNPHRTPITHKKILSTVAKFYNTSQSDIMGQKRNKEIVLPRQVAIYLMRKELGLSYPKIGDVMGGRDHTTIMHGYDKMEKGSREDDGLSTDLIKLKELIYTE